MKALKLVFLFSLIVPFGFCFGASAQEKFDHIPSSIMSAFEAHYPDAQLKNAKESKTGYDFKFTDKNKVYHAKFDVQGDWVETVSNISWQWHLPVAVKSGLKNAVHGTWHPYDISLVETPIETFYRVFVDNTNHPIDAEHQLVLKEDYEIDINPAGSVTSEKYTE